MAIVRGVFCDLDGTLVATEKANFAAYRAALGEFGIEFTWPVFLTTWGEDSRDFLPRIAPELSAGEVAGVRAAKARHYPAFLGETELNRPLARTLQTWSGTARVALVTTAKAGAVAAVLKHHDLTQLFSFVVTGDDTERSKPAPDPYLLALATAGLRPEDCITFEDSESDIRSAEGAGVDVGRIEWSADVA
ncbi:hydrolase [Leifsonia xyli subsp. xyli str. CTCB07]|uniref:Hydrolase n=2 Tax=Leifsonia xyli subsp. xyli TaxID=59736 RepID=Q6AH83_LEIXX|nr:hydrolase [Leifsonia xyli subsp. xyli str. CTCB07]